MRSLSLRSLAVLALIVVACGPAAKQTIAQKPVAATSGGKPLPAAETPARWVLHASRTISLRARLDVGDAGMLYAGNGGERWLEPRDATKGPSSAPVLLPEPIVALQRASDASILVIGASGAIYPTKDPLGNPGAKRAPAKPASSIAAGKLAVVAIFDGAMMRTTDGGQSWSKVALPGGVDGSLVQVSMLPTGAGLALLAPQRALATQDDGATWKAVATPGVGARRVVADVNGDLLVEGLEASAILRTDPLRLEKIDRAPTRDYELSLGDTGVMPLYADAVNLGHGALLGTRYVEVIGDPDEPTRWSVSVSELGKKPTSKKVHELDGCDNVFVGGSESVLELGCDREPKGDAPPTPTYKKPKVEERLHLELFRSEDFGVTFKPDGMIPSPDRETKHLWLTPDGALIVDGACKRSKNDWTCEESPPLIRVAGQAGFAKVIGQPSTHFHDLVFAPNGRAYAIGSSPVNERFALYVSTDGGKDFTRKNLPAIAVDGDDGPFVPQDTTIGNGFRQASITIDDAGNVVVAAAAPFGGEIATAIYVTADDGASFKSRVLPFRPDTVALAGRHAFAYSHDDRSFESSDDGATWSPIEAPHGPDDRVAIACSAYGCLLGDRATRVGWDGTAGSADVDDKGKTKKVIAARTLSCAPQGEWKTIDAVALPTQSNADLGGGTRFTIPKRDAKDGAIRVVVGERDKKGGFVTKEQTLFGPSPKDTATAYTMQLEGVAAIRYAFKRDSNAPTVKKPGTYSYNPYIPITAKQNVDVEVAWYVAATGKVYKGTIKNVGPLEPYRDVADGRDNPSTARYALVSIAMGGIHVRPLASSTPDAPLWFVSEAGKVEKLTWPEVPQKDVRGKPLYFGSLDAARVGKRSLVFGNAPGGLQMWMAWSHEGSPGWDVRTWSLWPETDVGDVRLRYMDSGQNPAFAVLFSGAPDAPMAAWMATLKTAEADPSTVMALPTQKQFGDPPRPCADKSWFSAARLSLPFVAGSRHPMLVKGDGLDLTMATSQAVVRVNDETHWCVSAFDAMPLAYKQGDTAYSALVFPDDLEHSALFRQAKTGSAEIAVRTMSCAYSTSAVPDSVLSKIDGFSE